MNLSSFKLPFLCILLHNEKLTHTSCPFRVPPFTVPPESYQLRPALCCQLPHRVTGMASQPQPRRLSGWPTFQNVGQISNLDILWNPYSPYNPYIPLQSPVCFASSTRECFFHIQEEYFLFLILTDLVKCYSSSSSRCNVRYCMIL